MRQRHTRTTDLHVRRPRDGRGRPSYRRSFHLAHRGFTLIELLVSIAILAVLCAMMLPAVQNARATARAAQCRSHLAQLGEAFHAYHLSHGSLPSGCGRYTISGSCGAGSLCLGLGDPTVAVSGRAEPVRGFECPTRGIGSRECEGLATCSAGVQLLGSVFSRSHRLCRSPPRPDGTDCCR